ncbi:MAG: nucleotide exchange factor GrpE [Treponemataceae bacterium]|nr:nucleotide exchange factor GrpE [Treponemataceae bacterium]
MEEMEENEKIAEQPCEQESSQAESSADESCEKCVDAEKASGEDTCAEQEAEKEPSPEERVEALEKENADLKDQLLRRAADFDNYRKRMIKEKQEAFDYANAALLQDLLESIDNLERTVAAAEGATDAKSIADGVKMISASLVSMLENKYNLTAYGAVGEAFNPDEHEALRSEPSDDVESPIIKEVYLKGYKLKDRVIRNAKVSVSMPNEK